MSEKLLMIPSKKTEFDKLTESMYEMDDQMNQTCPPDLIGGFDQQFIHSLSLRDVMFQKEFDRSVTSAIIAQDPCTLADDEREILLRKKRKEDAFKTALCESYRRTGECSYATGCRFAHGVDELRLPTQPRGRNHPKYKTVLCDKFSSTGHCKYGARCQFIHKITNPVILQQKGRIRDFGNDKENMSSDCGGSTRFRSYAVSGRGFNLNQSMPMEVFDQSDINRAFTRAAESSQLPRLNEKPIEGVTFTRNFLQNMHI
ncbi:unnamed protein product [Auanema sp. JU1783]|nr:unnamed protein product [Auanema sp. JU1783]